MLAAQQHGVVSATQLLERGLPRTAIQVRLRNGRLHPIHRGVYAVGHGALTLKARFMAAVLAGGPGAALGYRSAGAEWECMEWIDDLYLVEVVIPRSAPLRHPGVRIHRTRSLDARDVRRHDGIPITTPARTLLDLADILPEKGLRRAVRQAQALGLVSVRQIADVLTRAQGRRGAQRLAALIADGPTPTRSDLEDLVLGVVVDGGLQRPPGLIHDPRGDPAADHGPAPIGGFRRVHPTVRRRSTLDRAGSRDSSTIIGGSRLRSTAVTAACIRTCAGPSCA